jgi:uncharacterized protein (TIGR02246 family)
MAIASTPSQGSDPGPARAGAADSSRTAAPIRLAQSDADAGRRPTGGRQPAPTSDEAAIRAVDAEFIAEYNRGDSKALAARFTEDAEVAEADGTRYQGRPLIEERLAETFAAAKGVKLTLEIQSIRFLSPDVAKENGRSVVTPTQGAPLARLYTVLYVKRGGRWLMSSVREEPDPAVRPHEHLKDLEWMIGEWVDEDSDSFVRFAFRWSDDGNYLIRDVTVRRQGATVMSIAQRIGWDPQARRIRSWEFDSEGGFGEGTWSRSGDRWVVKHTGVRPDGTSASATNIMTRERPDVIRWVSTDRVLGDESDTEEMTYVMVRVPPSPRSQATGAKNPTQTSTPNTRSTR